MKRPTHIATSEPWRTRAAATPRAKLMLIESGKSASNCTDNALQRRWRTPALTPRFWTALDALKSPNRCIGPLSISSTVYSARGSGDCRRPAQLGECAQSAKRSSGRRGALLGGCGDERKLLGAEHPDIAGQCIAVHRCWWI